MLTGTSMNTVSPLAGTLPVDQLAGTLQSLGPLFAVGVAVTRVPVPVAELVLTNGLPAVAAVPVMTLPATVQTTSANSGMVLAASKAWRLLAMVVFVSAPVAVYGTFLPFMVAV